jgi:hypothetical protein
MMAEGSPQQRILRTALLDPIGDARALLGRLQSNEMFQSYLRERSLYALPLVAGVAITGTGARRRDDGVHLARRQPCSRC